MNNFKSILVGLWRTVKRSSTESEGKQGITVKRGKMQETKSAGDFVDLREKIICFSNVREKIVCCGNAREKILHFLVLWVKAGGAVAGEGVAVGFH